MRNHRIDLRAAWRGVGRTGVVALAALGSAVGASEVEPVASGGASAARSVGGADRLARSVPVAEGRASFDLRVDATETPSLVVVASLAKGAGPFSIEAKATPTLDRARPLAATPTLPRSAVTTVDAARVVVPAPARSQPPTDRTFHLMTQSGLATAVDSYRSVPARLRAVGRRVQVYVDASDTSAVDAATLADVVATFDERVWPGVAERFGPATDVDGDGRFTVLFTRWLGRLANGRVQVDGFVRGADFDARQPRPFGNAADLMFLNADLRSGPHLRAVLAHEYTHAVNFSRKVLDAAPAGGTINPLAEEEGWLDEALAHLIEDELGFGHSNIDHRVSAYLAQPERYRLVVEDYYLADLFRSHGNRGATYLFLRWAVDQFGPTLLDALIRSPRRGIANLEAATGVSFDVLFRAWTLATFRSGLEPTPPGPDDYRSVRLRSEWGGALLAGPRPFSLTAGDPPHLWRSGGTAVHYLIVGRNTPGTIHVEISGPAAADLQVTVLPLPVGLARPELVVRPVVANDGTVRGRARLTESGGGPTRLGALTWERLSPRADPHAPGWHRGWLAPIETHAVFGTVTLGRGGTLESAPILLAGVRAEDGPLVFKLVGTDSLGRRVAAWATARLTSVPMSAAPGAATGPPDTGTSGVDSLPGDRGWPSPD